MRIPDSAVRLATNGLTLAVLSGVCIGLGLSFGSGPLSSFGPLVEPAFAFDGTTAPSTVGMCTSLIFDWDSMPSVMGMSLAPKSTVPFVT